MALATSRWLTMCLRTTVAADLNAASVAAASPICQRNATLFGATSWICGEPGPLAFPVPVTEGSGSQSTCTASAASRAASWLSAITTATGSPTYWATSAASGGCGGIFSSGKSHPHGREFTPVMSLPVKIATIPGRAFAAETSIFRIRARAWGLRTKAAYVIPASFRSSVYRPRPVMNRGSSRRLMDLPNMRSSVALAMPISFPLHGRATKWPPKPPQTCRAPASPGRSSTEEIRLFLGGHRVGGPLDRFHDVVVAGAAAQVALELVADLLLRGFRVALEHLVDGHDHAGRAEAALQTVLLPEALLDRVQLAVLGEPFDRHDVGAVGLDGEHVARLHRLAVHDDRAGAALARVAAHVGPGQPDVLSDVVDEQQARLDLVGDRLAVDRHLHWQFHGSSSKRHADVETIAGSLTGSERKTARRACQRPPAG